MTSPNTPTQADILEARERVKLKVPPSFAKAIDAGEFDRWGLVQAALAEMIRERSGEEVGE